MFFYIPSSEQKSEGKNTILKTIATNCIYQDGIKLELDSLHYQAFVAKVLKKSLEPFWRFSKKR